MNYLWPSPPKKKLFVLYQDIANLVPECCCSFVIQKRKYRSSAPWGRVAVKLPTPSFCHERHIVSSQGFTYSLINSLHLVPRLDVLGQQSGNLDFTEITNNEFPVPLRKSRLDTPS